MKPSTPRRTTQYYKPFRNVRLRHVLLLARIRIVRYIYTTYRIRVPTCLRHAVNSVLPSSSSVGDFSSRIDQYLLRPALAVLLLYTLHYVGYDRYVLMVCCKQDLIKWLNRR